jgi:hypothetical protein
MHGRIVRRRRSGVCYVCGARFRARVLILWGKKIWGCGVILRSQAAFRETLSRATTKKLVKRHQEASTEYRAVCDGRVWRR